MQYDIDFTMIFMEYPTSSSGYQCFMSLYLTSRLSTCGALPAFLDHSPKEAMGVFHIWKWIHGIDPSNMATSIRNDDNTGDGIPYLQTNMDDYCTKMEWNGMPMHQKWMITVESLVSIQVHPIIDVGLFE